MKKSHLGSAPLENGNYSEEYCLLDSKKQSQNVTFLANMLEGYMMAEFSLSDACDEVFTGLLKQGIPQEKAEDLVCAGYLHLNK